MNDEANKTQMMDESGLSPEVVADATAASAPAQDAAEEGAPTPAEISADEYQELKTKAAKAEEHWNQLLRVSADFDNFRKRAARDRQDAIRYANETLLEKLIPIVDSFEMALRAASDPKANATDALKAGVTMIHGQLRGVLADAGLEEIDATSQPFNPNLHEAVSQEETTATPEGHVLQQLRKGYKLRDRLVRPASVVVARKPAA